MSYLVEDILEMNRFMNTNKIRISPYPFLLEVLIENVKENF